ncbi:hypothetical protein AB0I54_31150 [Streptomyces sp. NPDC050625]|uniref:hypothetical protein n=1 Tax=Streptomyces sp. NPDC050625 TaxID=3154629 RepID=UPI0034437AE4
MSTHRFRSLGTDPVTGKAVYAVTEAGGFLAALADAHALRAAVSLLAVVGAVLDADRASDAELAAFVRSLYDALAECVAMVAAERE